MHLFISYAKKDTRELALNLADALNALDGISAWVDRSLRAGRSWELQIQSEIDRCDSMIVLYSPDLNRHKQGEPESYVLTEIAYAKYTAKKPIIPVMAQKTDPPISLTMEHYIDFAGMNLTLDALVAALCDELEIEAHKSVQLVSFQTPNIDLREIMREYESLPMSDLTAKIPLKTDDITQIAHNFKGKHNADWSPIIQTFEVKGLSLDMCLVPVGSFLMGSNDISDREKPVHQQIVKEPYWIGLYPITNAQWRFAVKNSKGTVKLPYGEGWYKDKGKDNHPVVGVSWKQCQEFVKWLGTDWQLPTEVQWEYAARGLDNLVYPFGNEFKPDLVVYDQNSNKSTAAIAGRPGGTSWIGAQDMAGNVSEWNSTLYQPYPYKADDGRENLSTGSRRVLRGGSWGLAYGNARPSYRLSSNDYKYLFGFRVVCAL